MKNKRNMVLKATPIKRDANGNPVNEFPVNEFIFKPRVKKSKKRNR